MRGHIGAVGAVVALVLVGTAGTAGCTAEPAGRSAAPARSEGAAGPAAGAPAPPRMPSAPDLPGWAHSPGFAADGSGFTLLARCVEDEAQPENSFCRQHVAVLDKGAASWELRRSPLPEVRGTHGVSAQITVLGPGRALIREGSEEHPLRTWFTRDGGRSWTKGEGRPAGTVAAIPAGGALTLACAQPPGASVDDCALRQLLVISPEDGKFRALARGPQLGSHMRPADVAEPDGSWWASGVDPVSKRPAVAVSRDAGRSWATSVLPSPPTTNPWGVSVAVGPDAVYAAEMGELTGGEPVKNPMRALHRSLDGGRTWKRMWTTTSTDEPRTLLGLPVPGPGGRVTIHGEAGAYTSMDGGSTFRPAGARLGHVNRTPMGLLRQPGSGCEYGISADGVRWTQVRLACSAES
ncbi:WD40/YVTN/BNR-like repeat-containing protein [Streptomyces purpureus]|uniref:WD40/YVTN/BNR-like repeat-containing protein n=1 Tax=Streptomyces purpureus TaxID=1951 RepID=UPI003799EB0B